MGVPDLRLSSNVSHGIVRWAHKATLFANSRWQTDANNPIPGTLPFARPKHALRNTSRVAPRARLGRRGVRGRLLPPTPPRRPAARGPKPKRFTPPGCQGPRATRKPARRRSAPSGRTGSAPAPLPWARNARLGKLGLSTKCSRHTRNPRHKGPPSLSGDRPAQRPKAATRATAARARRQAAAPAGEAPPATSPIQDTPLWCPGSR